MASDAWLTPAYWRAVCPRCTVSKHPQPSVDPAPHVVKLVDSDMAEMKRRMDDDGYFHLPASKHSLLGGGEDSGVSGVQCHALTVSLVQEGVSSLVRLGWPPSFITIYDEAWCLAGSLREVMRGVTGGDRGGAGGNEQTGDMVAWHVDPNLTPYPPPAVSTSTCTSSSTSKGFPPHRDRHYGTALPPSLSLYLPTGTDTPLCLP